MATDNEDHCTGWPDEIDGKYYGDCCEDHDKAYALGGFFKKFKADFDLAKCVWERAEGNYEGRYNAVIIYLGISTFGWIFWTKCRFEK